MLSALANALASLSLMLKQPLTSFCDIETAHGDALVTKRGDYLTWVRIDGTRRMAERKDFAGNTEAMRLDLSSTLEARGHAIVGWYISDPDSALDAIERVNLTSCRNVANAIGLDLRGILDERAALWPKLMRWEAAYFYPLDPHLGADQGRTATTRPRICRKRQGDGCRGQHATPAPVQ